MTSEPPSIRAYDAAAHDLAEAYEDLRFDEIHEPILDLLPKEPARILDVGAGSGRDAAWFCYRGHEVVAVEPSAGMRREARERHSSINVRWVEDSLPGLTEVHRLGLTFDFVLVNAVWMHVPPEDRRRAFRKLSTLLAPNGRMAISLRLGNPIPGRDMFPVSSAELAHLAGEFGLRVARLAPGVDRMGRDDVRWETMVLEYPDDDAGALPVLRHIVLRDDKSSTYKLALLRAVARAADSAPGMAREAGDGKISLPLGLIALFWLRMMKPLVESDYPQTPTSRSGGGLGFVRESFHRLRNVAPFDLRPGMFFHGEIAAALGSAMSAAARTVCRMPATYITYPGRGQQVFVTSPMGFRVPAGGLSLDEPCLRAFGEFIVPEHIWRVLGRLNVWIEPVLIGEWIAVMQRYGTSQGRALGHDELARALAWLDPVRDIRIARDRAITLLESGERMRCVWSGKALSGRSLDIDHCFPFSAWPCSDLWNLLPASRDVNRNEKRAKLVSAARLGGARDAMLDWWTRAWAHAGEPWRPRFLSEARSTLPLVGVGSTEPTLDEVFEGVQVRRALLRQDQRLPEWGQDMRRASGGFPTPGR